MAPPCLCNVGRLITYLELSMVIQLVSYRAQTNKFLEVMQL